MGTGQAPATKNLGTFSVLLVSYPEVQQSCYAKLCVAYVGLGGVRFNAFIYNFIRQMTAYMIKIKTN